MASGTSLKLPAISITHLPEPKSGVQVSTFVKKSEKESLPSLETQEYQELKAKYQSLEKENSALLQAYNNLREGVRRAEERFTSLQEKLLSVVKINDTLVAENKKLQAALDSRN